MRGALLLLAVSACGKIGFDPVDAPGDDAAVCPMTPPSAMVIKTTVTDPSQFAGSCGGATSPELVFPFDMPAGATVVLAADETTADTAVYIATSCDPVGHEVACDQRDGMGEGGQLVETLPSGTYYAFVDGEQTTSSLDLGIDFAVELPEGAPCTGIPPYWHCGPNLACTNTTCAPTCVTPVATLQGSLGYLLNGTNVGTSVHAGTCGDAGDGGRRGAEDLYVLRLVNAASAVTVSTDDPATDFDTLIYMRTGCMGAEIACNDDVSTGNNVASKFVTGPLVAGDYYVFVDSFGTASGAYRLRITITP